MEQTHPVAEASCKMLRKNIRKEIMHKKRETHPYKFCLNGKTDTKFIWHKNSRTHLLTPPLPSPFFTVFTCQICTCLFPYNWELPPNTCKIGAWRFLKFFYADDFIWGRKFHAIVLFRSSKRRNWLEDLKDLPEWKSFTAEQIININTIHYSLLSC